MTSPLQRELAHHNYLREQLAEQFPEETEESLADTLEGETDLREMLAKVTRSALWDEALANGATQRETELRIRIARLKYRATKKRELVRSVMERAELKKIEAPDMTISMRACPARLMVTDEDQIPEEFLIQQPPKIDKGHIKQLLKYGTSVPGAHLSNQPPTLSVRTK